MSCCTHSKALVGEFRHNRCEVAKSLAQQDLTAWRQRTSLKLQLIINPQLCYWTLTSHNELSMLLPSIQCIFRDLNQPSFKTKKLSFCVLLRLMHFFSSTGHQWLILYIQYQEWSLQTTQWQFNWDLHIVYHYFHLPTRAEYNNSRVQCKFRPILSNIHWSTVMLSIQG